VIYRKSPIKFLDAYAAAFAENQGSCLKLQNLRWLVNVSKITKY
jgi:hypothetical protein